MICTSFLCKRGLWSGPTLMLSSPGTSATARSDALPSFLYLQTCTHLGDIGRRNRSVLNDNALDIAMSCSKHVQVL